MKASFLSFLLCLALGCAVSLCGCGADDENNETQKPVLHVALESTFPPFAYHENGKITGIDVDILREIAENLGYTLEITNMELNAILPAVNTDKFEIGAGGISVTKDREQLVAFTVPYIRTTQVAIVLKKSPITTSSDLKKDTLRIGVKQGTTGDIYVTKRLRKPLRFENLEKLLDALIKGEVDVAVCDSEPSRVYVAKHPELKILPAPLSSEEYAFALSNRNVALLRDFNVEIFRMRNSGRIQKIIDSYLLPKHP